MCPNLGEFNDGIYNIWFTGEVSDKIIVRAGLCCSVAQSCPALSDPMDYSMPGSHHCAAWEDQASSKEAGLRGRLFHSNS